MSLTCSNGHLLSDATRPCPHCATQNLPSPGSDLPTTVAETPGALSETVNYEPSASADANRPVPAGYEIESELGRGGMGVVYRARQIGLNRLVALKMILVGGHAGTSAVARFLAEAQAIARLEHPHIVRVHQVGEVGGLPYFSLEFCPGGSLDRKLAGTPMPGREAGELVARLARAVAYAHEQGIVHRDLKPANVLLAADGTPKVTDFGIAKRLDDDAGATPSGAIMGTPSYMAPEQAEGRTAEVGPAADLYALGAILYECLTGRPPFKGATLGETLQQVIRQEPVPPSRLNPQVPRDLETICLKCLEKEPSRRYANADRLADDLERYGRGEPIHARPVGLPERSVKWVRRNPVVAGLLAAVLVSLSVGLSASLWFAFDAAEQARQANHNANRAIESEGKAKTSAAEARASAEEAWWSEQRATVNAEIAEEKEFEARREKKAADQERDVARLQARKAEAGKYTAQLGQALNAWQGHDLLEMGRLLQASPAEFRNSWEVNVLTGAMRRRSLPLLGHHGYISALAYSPDGRFLLSADWGGQVRLWDASTSQPLAILRERPIDGLTRGVAFSRDGNRAAAVDDNRRVTVWDTRTHREVASWPIPPQTSRAVGFAPDGRSVYVGGWNGMVCLEVETGRVLRTTPMQRANDFAFDPQGRWAATQLGGEVVLLDPAGGEEVARFAHPSPREIRLGFSADGRRLAATSGQEQVTVWDLEQRRVINRFDRSGLDLILNIALSPDGSRVAAGITYGPIAVWEVVTGRRTLLRAHVVAPDALAFSPDGRFLASGGNDRVLRLWDPDAPLSVIRTPPVLAVSADGRQAVRRVTTNLLRIHDTESQEELGQVHLGNIAPPNRVWFAPDGGLLISHEDRLLRLWDPTTGQQRQTFRGGLNVFDKIGFSANGKILVGIDIAGSLFSWDVATGRVRRNVGRLEEASPTSLLVSPDGERAYVGFYDGVVRVVSLTFGLTLRRFNAHPDEVSALVLDPTGNTLITGGKDLTVKLWPGTGGNQPRTILRGIPAPIQVLALQPGGRMLAIGTEGGGVHLWDLALELPVLTLPGPLRGLLDLHFSPDGQRLIARDWNATVHVWDGRASPSIRVLPGTISDWPLWAFSPDGQWLATASVDETLRCWNVETGAEVLAVTLPESRVTDLAFSADGERIALSGLGGGIRVVDRRTGNSLWSSRLGNEWVRSLAFSPRGDQLAAGTEKGGIRRIDLPQGKEAPVLVREMMGIERLLYTPDGSAICFATKQGRLVAVDPATGQVRWSRPAPDSVQNLFWDPAGKSLGVLTQFGAVHAIDPQNGNPLPPGDLHRLPAVLGTNPAGTLFATGDSTRTLLLAQSNGIEQQWRRIRSRPEPSWHREQGRLAQGIGQPGAAAFHLRRLSRLEPWNVSARWDEARAWAAAGEPTQAVRAVLEAGFLDPGGIFTPASR